MHRLIDEEIEPGEDQADLEIHADGGDDDIARDGRDSERIAQDAGRRVGGQKQI